MWLKCWKILLATVGIQEFERCLPSGSFPFPPLLSPFEALQALQGLEPPPRVQGTSPIALSLRPLSVRHSKSSLSRIRSFLQRQPIERPRVRGFEPWFFCDLSIGCHWQISAKLVAVPCLLIRVFGGCSRGFERIAVDWNYFAVSPNSHPLPSSSHIYK